MLRILGNTKRLCDGMTRRDLLWVGEVGSLAPWAVAGNRAQAEAQLAGFGAAKNVILLYLFGGPSHLEMFDVKPAAPPRFAAPKTLALSTGIMYTTLSGRESFHRFRLVCMITFLVGLR